MANSSNLSPRILLFRHRDRHTLAGAAFRDPDVACWFDRGRRAEFCQGLANLSLVNLAGLKRELTQVPTRKTKWAGTIRPCFVS